MITLSIQDITRHYFIVMKELMCVSFLFLSVLRINAITPTGFLLHKHTSFNSRVSLLSGCTLKYLPCNEISQRALSVKAVSTTIFLQMYFWAVPLSMCLKYYLYTTNHFSYINILSAYTNLYSKIYIKHFNQACL